MDGRSNFDDIKKKLTPLISKQAAEIQSNGLTRSNSDIRDKQPLTNLKRSNDSAKENVAIASSRQLKATSSEIKLFGKKTDSGKAKKTRQYDISEPVIADAPINRFNDSIDKLKQVVAARQTLLVKDEIASLARLAVELPEKTLSLKLNSLLSFFNSPDMEPFRPYLVAQFEIQCIKKGKLGYYRISEGLKKSCPFRENNEDFQRYNDVFNTIKAEQTILAYDQFLGRSTSFLWGLYLRAICSRLTVIARTVFNIKDDKIPINDDVLISIYKIFSLINNAHHDKMKLNPFDLGFLKPDHFNDLRKARVFYSDLEKNIQYINDITGDLIICYQELIEQQIAEHLRIVLEKYPSRFMEYTIEMNYIRKHINSYRDSSMEDEKYYFLTAIKIISIIDGKKQLSSIFVNDMLHYVIGYLRNKYSLSEIKNFKDLESIKQLLLNDLAVKLCEKFDLENRLPHLKEKIVAFLRNKNTQSMGDTPKSEDGSKLLALSLFNQSTSSINQYSESVLQPVLPPPLPPRESVRKSIYIVGNQDEFSLNELIRLFGREQNLQPNIEVSHFEFTKEQ